MIKVAFLSYYSGLLNRGVETFVHELANRLFSLGIDVTVYQHGPALSGSAYTTGFLKSLTGLPEFSSPPDIIIPTNGRLQAVLSKLWSVVHHKKLLITGHSGPGLDDRLNLYCFPDFFIGLTHYQIAWAKRINPCVRTLLIPNGIDLAVFNPKVKPITIDLPHPIILHVGALESSKRQDLLVKAAAAAGSNSVLLVGQGSRQSELFALGKKLLGNRFQILSFPPRDMPQVYSACDLFSYPSVSWESFGIVLLEAMASGLPVVAADDPIRREIVGSAGLFVDPEDTTSYSASLLQALHRNWESLPREQAAKYSWNEVAEKYSSALSKLISKQ